MIGEFFGPALEQGGNAGGKGQAIRSEPRG